MNKKPEKTINFISNAKKKLNNRFIYGMKNHSKGKNTKKYFPTRPTFIQLFIIEIMPLNSEHRKYTEGNKFTKLITLSISTIWSCLQEIKKEVKTLIQAIRIFCQDVGRESAIEKCAILIIKSGKRKTIEETGLTNPNNIRALQNEGKLRSGIQEVNTIKQTKMK